jgi:hypothetical protein
MRAGMPLALNRFRGRAQHEEALAQLVRSELIFCRGEAPESVRLTNEVIEGVYVAAPIRAEYGIDGEALIAFIISKHAVPEELVCLFDFFIFIALIVDDSDPSADAGQCPHIKRYTGGVKSFQNTDVQPCCRPTTAERNCSFDWFLFRHLNALYMF